MTGRLAILPLLAAALCGCVGVKHEHGLVPPRALCSDIRAPLVVPRGPVPCANLKVGKGSSSVYVKEWVYSGASVDATNMALEEAVKAGGIRHLHFADYEQYSVLGFVTVFSVTAYGE